MLFLNVSLLSFPTASILAVPCSLICLHAQLQNSQLPARLLLEARKDLAEHALPLPGVVELKLNSLDSASAQALAAACYSPAGLRPSLDESQQISAACGGVPLKICLLSAAVGSGRAELQVDEFTC